MRENQKISCVFRLVFKEFNEFSKWPLITLATAFPNLYRSPSESSYSPEHMRKRDASIPALVSADLVLRLNMIILYR